MVKKPIVLIKINDVDKSSNIMKYLDSISLIDNANNEPDSLTITINERFKRPAYKDQIKVYLGYTKENMNFFGLFRVETTDKTLTGLTINAEGINYGDGFKIRRNITYEKLSIKDIINQIAQRHELKIKSDFEDIYLTSQAQTNESDMHFLNRIAKEYNAIFNVKNDTIYFMKKIKKNKKSDKLPKFEIDLHQCDTSRIKHSNKTQYDSCEVSWHDTKENKRHTVLVPANGGSSILKFKGSFKNKAEAIEKAKAKLQRANQGLKEGNLGKSGESIFAGGSLTLSNNIDADTDEYSITKVSHNISKSEGWKIDVEFES